jgi:hypothetical protein
MRAWMAVGALAGYVTGLVIVVLVNWWPNSAPENWLEDTLIAGLAALVLTFWPTQWPWQK